MSAGYSKSVSDDACLLCHPTIHGSSIDVFYGINKQTGHAPVILVISIVTLIFSTALKVSNVDLGMPWLISFYIACCIHYVAIW